MASSNLEPSAAFTCAREGGEKVSLATNDTGNYFRGVLVGSKFGLTAATLVQYLGYETVTAADIRGLTMKDFEAVYAAAYWQALNGDALPVGIDCMVVDHGYNRGMLTSGKVFQRFLGMRSSDVDGWIGTQTVGVMSAYDVTPALPKLSANAAKRLQKFLGVAADGTVGPLTKAAALKGPSVAIMCAALADAQIADYSKLSSVYQAAWQARVWLRLDEAYSMLQGAKA